ncbi:MAG: YIP1 family protein [Chloroflexi bacterium]|nr:YIP1 family protein [Chloroflexota bacterium]
MAGGIGGNLRGALALDRETYEHIADKPSALVGALGCVIVATALAGLGGLLWTAWGGHPANFTIEPDADRFLRRSVLYGGAIQLGMWVAWVSATWLYLWSYGERVAPARLARVMGYAFAPMGLQLFIGPPGLEFAAAAVAVGYTIAAMLVGVQTAAGTTSLRALVSVMAGFALFAVTLSLLGNGNTDLAPGFFALDPVVQSVGFVPLRP